MKRILLLLFAIFPILAIAHDFEKDGIYYNISGKTVSVTFKGDNYSDHTDRYSGNVIIPESVVYNEENYTVIGIGRDAFYKCTDLKSITIPRSVTSIGSWAFFLCTGLTAVEIPNRVQRIDDHAFSGCSGLNSITIPNSVQRIGDNAFNECSGLNSITIPNSVTFLGKNAFSSCAGDLKVNCNIYNYEIRLVYQGVFYGSNFNSVEIGPDVKIIANGAFGDCKILNTVTIPKNVETIKGYAFKGCTGKLVLNCNLIYDNDGEYSYKINFSASKFREVEIGSAVESLGSYAFYENDSLRSVTIFDGLKNIGYESFERCSNLVSVTIPNSVHFINSEAFYYCSSLTSVTIPDSVTFIGARAFSGCSSLTSVTIPNSVTSIGHDAFYPCSSLTSIKVMADNQFYDSRNDCNAIIETSSNNLLLGCSNTVIPASVKRIEGGAFASNKGLTNITIPYGVTSIGSGAFSGCSNLASITIHHGITCIDERTFIDCSNLTTITIPSSVTSIGNYAFSNCMGLQNVFCKAVTPPTLEEYTFEKANQNGTLYVPKESISAYETAEGWRQFYVIKAINNPLIPILEEDSEVTEQNAEDITVFKMNVESGSTFAVNDDAKVELWIGNELNGISKKSGISEKSGVVSVKFTPSSNSAGARGMHDEFWKTVEATASDDVAIVVKIAKKSFKINGEDIEDELSFQYIAKASVAEKISQNITSLDDLIVGDANLTPVYDINGSHINSYTQNGIIIKNGNKILVK